MLANYILTHSQIRLKLMELEKHIFTVSPNAFYIVQFPIQEAAVAVIFTMTIYYVQYTKSLKMCNCESVNLVRKEVLMHLCNFENLTHTCTCTHIIQGPFHSLTLIYI